MKKWEIKNTSKVKDKKLNTEGLIDLLLENRGIKTKKDREVFLHPKLEEVTIDGVGIDRKQLDKALKRIQKAFDDKEQIIIYGDYDVDGITGTAILWETLHAMGAKVMPYIPHRVDEGYGLSEKGIGNLTSQFSPLNLIITVDNGIVASDAVAFANGQGIDVIITDHHTIGEELPNAHAIVHTTNLCGAGVAYLLSKELIKRPHPDPLLKGEGASEKALDTRGTHARPAKPLRSGDTFDTHSDVHLELAALGTVADLVPLTGANRAIVKFGLEKLSQTKRPGLQELYQLAGINLAGDTNLGVYEIGHVIAPRLNAAGRLESAMDSLRLICTKDRKRGHELAAKLDVTNRERQVLMREATEHAVGGIKNSHSAKATRDKQESGIKKLLFVGHETYREGVIGLVAGRLVEEFYRPSIVLSIGKEHSKGSARSISGFNIIEFLRLHEEHFVGLGGHPMAAGFTIETAKMSDLQKLLEEAADEIIEDEILVRTLRIDCELPLEMVTQEFYQTIQQLSPFGMGNPEPVFVSRNVIIKDMKILGKDKKHLKLQLEVPGPRFTVLDSIAFGMAEKADKLKIGDAIDVAYTIDENVWNGNVKLQLKIKDLKLN